MYVIEVVEDDEAESKVEKKVYTANNAGEAKKTTGKDLLTQELKNMSADELRA